MSTVSSQHVKKPGGRRTAAIAGACLLAAAGAGAILCRDEIRARYLLATRFEGLGPKAQGYREYRPLFCRSASRAWNEPGMAGADVGFRPVFNLR